VDYLFRYDRGAFWLGRLAFKYFVTPFNRITRWVLDDFMHTRVMYHALHKSGHGRRYLIQDVGIPYPAAEEFLEYVDRTLGFYPLWLCPLRQHRHSQASMFSVFACQDNTDGSESLLNVGVWGRGPSGLENFVEANRQLERKVQEVNGRKWLYAHTYYSEDEFWSLYDKKAYDSLRAKYCATYLPNVFDKVKVDVRAEKEAVEQSWVVWLVTLFWSIWPLSGLYGVLHTIVRKDYLVRRDSIWETKRKAE
jgi:Delta24-sterol reductase